MCNGISNDIHPASASLGCLCKVCNALHWYTKNSKSLELQYLHFMQDVALHADIWLQEMSKLRLARQHGGQRPHHASPQCLSPIVEDL